MSIPPVFDIIAFGELLIDLISTDYADDLSQAEHYKRLPGGSPANLAANMCRLGKQAALVSAVGQDAAGDYLLGYAQNLGLDTSRLRQVGAPTTLILVTKSKAVSGFAAYRGADAQIVLDQADLDWVCQSSLVHTTAFALSLEPARSHILEAVRQASKAGVQASIDANYAPQIWPDRVEAQKVVGDYLALGALAKFSEVDYERLFQEQVTDPAQAAQRIRDLGARLVCLTLGEQGVYVLSDQGGFHLEARKVEVKDTTGAGDAFWSGFLSAYLDQKSPLDCAKAGRAVAEKKLGIFGPLPQKIDLAEIY